MTDIDAQRIDGIRKCLTLAELDGVERYLLRAEKGEPEFPGPPTPAVWAALKRRKESLGKWFGKVRK
jgi:hypothetical protein